MLVEQIRHSAESTVFGHHFEHVLDVGFGLGCAGIVSDRIALITTYQLVHCPVERGGIQHHLAGRCESVENLAHSGQEPHVGHAVGLVEHGDAHRAQVDVAPRQQVFESPRRGDHDRRPRHLLHLWPITRAAEHRRHP